MNPYHNDKSKIVSPSQTLIETFLIGASFVLIVVPFVGSWIA